MKNIQNDPQYYVIQSNCTYLDDFHSNFNDFTFVHGGYESVILSLSSKDIINEFINNHNQCSFKYDYFHPLLKVFDYNYLDQ